MYIFNNEQVFIWGKKLEKANGTCRVCGIYDDCFSLYQIHKSIAWLPYKCINYNSSATSVFKEI